MTEKDQSEKMPATIGRYQIQESVGFGAMGAVYKAFDPLIKRTLAIKTIRLDIPKQSAQYQSFIERFYHEARISGTLSHPHIVTLFDIGEEHGIPYLAMEYVPGDTVSALLEKGPRFAPERVVSVVSQVASAVDYAHGRGVVHRDIKPSNIILHEGDKVKVTDFGIAKLANADMTQSGTLLGTPSYMSPEQAMGEKVDGRSDIFSLGVCAYEMLSSRQPFPGSNVTAILYKLVNEEPEVPADLEAIGLVPDKWREVFAKVLAKKPADRYETAGAFVADLEYCLASWFGGLSDATMVGARVTSPEDATVVTAATATVAPPVAEDATVTVVRRPDAKEDGAAANADATVAIPPKAPHSGDPGATVATPLARPVAAQQPPVGGAVKAPVPPAPPAAAAPSKPAAPGSAPKRGGLPMVVLGAAALLVVGLVGWLLMRRAPIPEPTPAPVVAETPSAEPTVAAPVTGTLHVESDPAGAAVMVNGEAKGNTPLDLTGLPFGDLAVKVDQRGYESQTQTVSLSAAAAAAEVKVTLARRTPTTASIDISSTPLGADVLINGGIVGRTPILDLKLRANNYKVEVRREGYEPFSTNVRLEAGKKGTVDAALRAVAAAPAATAPSVSHAAQPVDTSRVYAIEEVDKRPNRIAGVTASYPSNKLPRLRQGQAASVTVSFLVSEAGAVSDIKVTESGGPVLDEEVVNAVRGFRYSPGEKGGQPVKVRLSFKQTFRGA